MESVSDSEKKFMEALAKLFKIPIDELELRFENNKKLYVHAKKIIFVDIISLPYI